MIKNNNQSKFKILSLIAYCLAFAIFISVLFSALAFDLEFKNRASNSIISNVIKIESTETGFANQFCSVYSESDFDVMSKGILFQEKIVSQTINNGRYPSIISIDGQKNIQVDSSFNMKFIDMHTSNGIVPSAVNKKLIDKSNNGFIKVGTSFDGDGARQVLLSEKRMAELGLNLNCVGKKISITLIVPNTEFDNYTSGYAENITVIDDDNIVGNKTINSSWNNSDAYVKTEFAGGQIKIFENYVIKGIINSEYEQIENNAPDMWLTMVSLKNQNNSYLPSMMYGDVYNEFGWKNKARIITYLDADIVSLSNRATAEGMVFPLFLRGGFVSKTIDKWSVINTCEPIIKYEITYKNYRELKSFYEKQTKAKEAVSISIGNDITEMLIYDKEHAIIQYILIAIGFFIGVLAFMFTPKSQSFSVKTISKIVICNTILSLSFVLFKCFSFNNYGGINNWNVGLRFALYPIAWLVINVIGILLIMLKSKIIKIKQNKLKD